MKQITYLLILVFTLAACKETYKPNISYPTTGYLVVEGFINSGQGGTTIKLSRTVKLDSNIKVIYENFAKVTIEGDNNSSFALNSSGLGVYTTGQLSLDNKAKYRIKIITADGKTYASDFSQTVKTPPMDSLSIVRENNGATLYMNTHDPENSTWYYRWEYEETWEYRALYTPTLKYILNPQNHNPIGVQYINADHDADTTKFRCWRNMVSSKIITATSTKLSEDRIHAPLLFVDETSDRFSVLYSIYIRQFGLSRSGYDFWQKMKRNTEQLGSIFDAQPSEITGNIHCLTNPSEPVVGYIDVAYGQEKRYFISKSQVSDWKYQLMCFSKEIDNIPDSIANYSYLYPVEATDFGPNPNIITKFYASSPQCVDCTTAGGTNKKPAFWPN